MPRVLDLQRLDGRVALVTGAGAGIGRATAQALGEAGARVIVTDIDAEAAARVADETGHADAQALDVGDEAAIVRVVGGVIARHGRLDLLVNNVGIGARLPAVELTAET